MSPKYRTAICAFGIIIGVLAILFISIVVGVLIIVTSFYYLKKPGMADQRKSGKPSWWWRWLTPSTPSVEVGIIVLLVLLLFGIMMLSMGIIGTSFPSSDFSFPPLANAIIGLLIVIICIPLGLFLYHRESDDYHYRIAMDTPIRIKKRNG